MLACSAMVACTNEELIETEDIKKPQAELVRGDAYVNFAINTKTDSSRGTVGDGDGNADDSGHHVAGTRDENNVNKLLLVIAKVDDNNADLANPTLYTDVKIESEHKVQNGYVGIFSGDQLSTSDDGTVSLSAPIRLDYTGKYAVLAVVNPVSGLTTGDNAITPGMNHKVAYERILEFDGAAYEGTSFQMSNKEVCLIEATPAHNVPTNPVTAPIAVERTVSKTTWRYTPNFTSGVTVPTNLIGKPNLYEVKVNVNNSTLETENYWFKEELTSTANGVTKTYDAYYYGYRLYKAKDTKNNVYWVLTKAEVSLDNTGRIDSGDVLAIFANTFFTQTELDILNDQDEYVGVIDDTNNDFIDDGDNAQSLIGLEKTAKVLKDSYPTAKERVTKEFVEGLTLVYTMTPAENPDYYFVNLTHYALTNLTNSAYAVRHIKNGNTVRAMGYLNTGEYLETPYTSALNSLAENAIYSGFTNNLEDVNEAAANLTFTMSADGKTTVTDASEIFKILPTSGTTDGTAMDDEENVTGHNNKDVGYFMQYLTENSVEALKQKANTVTGVVLAGQIYDNTGAIVPVLYKYNQKYYRTLRALINDGNNGLKYTKGGNEIALTENTTDEDAALVAGLDVYPNGRCFYYSANIKHFVYPSEVTAENRYMEHAIMRNNIYSLAVKSISDIGDAQLELTPSTPISDIRSYVQLEVSILPWIVRFNDLEL